ncbi:hypothetical protein HJG60_008896 [Phyllostomus discolor]|uniref:Secreted protein n=1 Tax=Phyllostomus discolor TaxID=89673 RepID=A0A833YSS3_9CHIR|nr:hypothetical protein HJG60_008896 [Phyllostomus discolor]
MFRGFSLVFTVTISFHTQPSFALSPPPSSVCAPAGKGAMQCKRHPRAGFPTPGVVPTDGHTDQLEPNPPVEGNVGSCRPAGAEGLRRSALREQAAPPSALPAAALPSPSQSLPICKPLGCYWGWVQGFVSPSLSNTGYSWAVFL